MDIGTCYCGKVNDINEFDLLPIKNSHFFGDYFI